MNSIQPTAIEGSASLVPLLPGQLTSTLTVLLIEASGSLQAVIKIGLGLLANAQVHTVTAGQNWPTVLQDQQPDLLLLDISVEPTGLLQTLQNAGLNPRVPIVCLVNRDRTYDHLQAHQYGAVATIAKPFDLQDLADVVRNVAEQHHPVEPSS